MRTREKLRTVGDFIAITIFWAAIMLLTVIGTAYGDCFEPGCGDDRDRIVKIAISLVAIGFVSHIVGHLWLKARKARRD